MFFLGLVLQQGGGHSRAEALFHEAMAAAPAEGLPALVRRLDRIAGEIPVSPIMPDLLETIQVIGLLHPGSVPDRPVRLASLKARAAGNAGLARVLKRIEILQAYYQAAGRGQSEREAATLSDPVFEGSILGVQAQADAALRARDYRRAESLAMRVLEADPYSPLLADAHAILGLSAAFQGDARAAVRHFRKAAAVTELPTLYGDTRNYLFTASRFALPGPAPVGEVFDEMAPILLTGFAGLKDPQSLALAAGNFILVDKEQTVRISPDGEVLEAKPARKIVDAAAAGDGTVWLLAEDGIDPGTGSMVQLSLSSGGKARPLRKLRSLAFDQAGDVYLLDQDAGLLRGRPAEDGRLEIAALAPVRGELVRVDGRGNLFVLEAAGKSVLLLSREGKQLLSVTTAPVGGRAGAIGFFALDVLNHIYVLDSNSMQIFAINDGTAGPAAQLLATLPLEQRPPFKNLRVLGVTGTGEVVVTGKNDDTWIRYR